jgi:hypothetical protein
MKRFFITASAIFITALLLAGCVTYDQDLYIGEDGSGIVKVHYSLLNLDTGEDMGTGVDVIPASFSTDKKEIREMYRGGGVELKDVKIESDETITDVYLLIKFDNVLDLNGHGVWDENQVIGTRIEDGTLVFIQDISNPDARILSSEEKKLYDSYVFSYSLRLPNDVVKTNGLSSKDRRTVYWEYPLSVIEANPHLQMHASCEAPAKYSPDRSSEAAGILSGVSLFAIVGCCATVIFILIIILVVVLLKRKKKPVIPQSAAPKPKTGTSAVRPGPEKPEVQEERSEETLPKTDPVEAEILEEIPKPETEEVKPPTEKTKPEVQEKKQISKERKWETTEDSFD